MIAKGISAFLKPPKMTVRGTLLSLTGGRIALLLVAAVTSFYKRDYRDGLLCFVVATLLGLVFFRKRKLALVVTSLSCILALGGIGFPFHPSFPATSPAGWFSRGTLSGPPLVLQQVQQVSVPVV